ncbi:TIGR03085 family metal-binding protein [Mariniluteicoccus endophyticus]
MNQAKTERAELCDLLDRVGPDAPTLCEGWKTHDLAAHLWIRETDPLAAPGLVARPLAGLTERRLAEAKGRYPYAELVDRVRRGPARLSVFAFPGVDEEANTVEYFVHHEDVRRAGGGPFGPRDLPGEFEDWLWRRMKLMGRAMFRRSPVGLVLERAQPAEGAVGEPESVRVMTGSEIVTVIGRPSELFLFGYGRQAAADVRLVGPDEAVSRISTADLGI